MLWLGNMDQEQIIKHLNNIDPSNKVFGFTKDGSKAFLVICALISNNSSMALIVVLLGRFYYFFYRKGETGAQKWSTPSQAI